MSKPPSMLDYGRVTHPFVFASRVGLGQRTLAMLLDLAILALPLLVFSGGMWMAMSSNDQLFALTGLSAVIVAYIAFECIFRASPGKLKLRMVVRHANGQRASWSIMLVRSILKLLWVLIPMMMEWLRMADVYILSEHGWGLRGRNDWMLGFWYSFAMMFVAAPMLLGVFAAWGDSRQTLYDRLTHTAVHGGELGRE